MRWLPGEPLSRSMRRSAAFLASKQGFSPPEQETGALKRPTTGLLPFCYFTNVERMQTPNRPLPQRSPVTGLAIISIKASQLHARLSRGGGIVRSSDVAALTRSKSSPIVPAIVPVQTRWGRSVNRRRSSTPRLQVHRELEESEGDSLSMPRPVTLNICTLYRPRATDWFPPAMTIQHELLSLTANQPVSYCFPHEFSGPASACHQEGVTDDPSLNMMN